MAELTVQPKKKSSILPWILLLLGILALIWWFFIRDKGDHQEAATATTTDSSANVTTATTTPVASANWNDVDMSVPTVGYEEITDKNIEVRGNDTYSIYSLGENVLFDEGKASLRTDAAANLKQVASSIDKRYKGGEIRVYGYTDSVGSAGYNKELAQQRADAVKDWMQSNGMDAGHISEAAIGEGRPVATNTTEAGRQQNRRVEIVARAGGAQ